MKILLLLCILTMAGASAGAAVPIAARGVAKCTIVTQPGATAAELHAAQDLADTLKSITGAAIPVATVDANPPAPAIIVGPGPVAKALFPAVDLERFGGEQLTMRTKGAYLLLAGGRPRGTLYAVYRFLQEQCGMRWWTPWAAKIPHHASLTVGDLSVDETPAFESRDPYWHPAFNADWAVRNGSNSQSAGLDDAHGGAIRYEGFVHTSYPLVPPATYASIHPEWYSLINGKRTFENAQLCTTNPQLRDFLVDRIRERIKANPAASILSLSQNDCGGACECDVCKPIDDREGSHSATMLSMVNYVAERIGKEYPNVAIDTLAYQYTRKAPKDIRPLPNVIVRLCSIECNFGAPLDDPSNKSFAADIVDWSRLCQRLYIWDYSTNFAHYVQPQPNWFVQGPNLRFFHDHGVKGVFEEGAYSSSGLEMSEMRAWLQAQLFWNPYQDDKKLIREFLSGYYGAAAQPIWDYLTLVSQKAKGYYLTCYSSPTAPFLNFDTMNRAELLWQKAEAAVKSDPDLLWRVKVAHLPVRYDFLVNWTRYRRDCLRSGAVWPVDHSRKAVADAWMATAVGPGPAGWPPMTAISEGGVTPQTFIARFAEDLPDPVVLPLPARGKRPAAPAGIPDADPARSVDVQDNYASLYREGELAELRGDPTASDGMAVWMPGSHHEWATQFPLLKLPPAVQRGRWKIYALVRVEANDGADPASAAFTAGVYDTAANKSRGDRQVSIGDAGAGYHPYLLGTVDTNTDQYVWAAPTANPGVKAVWIDRIYFVPAAAE